MRFRSVGMVRAALAVAGARSDEISMREKELVFKQLYGGTGEKGEQSFVPFTGPCLDGGAVPIDDFQGARKSVV